MQERFGYQLDMRLLQGASIEEKLRDSQANAQEKIGELTTSKNS